MDLAWDAGTLVDFKLRGVWLRAESPRFEGVGFRVSGRDEINCYLISSVLSAGFSWSLHVSSL